MSSPAALEAPQAEQRSAASGLFRISAHPQAPLFSQPDALDILDDAIIEAGSSSMSTVNQVIRSVLRQAALVSLWFYLRFVAGHNGPFQFLQNQLALELCAFYQDVFQIPGLRVAVFMPRFHGKSTVFTMGGPAWEADRNPEECHLITNAVKEGAEEFVGVIKDIADSNEFHGYLFPETIPPRNATRWNQKELVWTNRRRNWKEPTFRPAGAEGAAEGRHFHDHRMDDLVGLGQLDAARRSNVEMRKRRDWATSNEFSLLRGPSSRLWSIGTRFATDDIYTFITEDIKEIHGYRSMDLRESPTGRWIVYNREWKEDGRIICPEMVNDEMMDTLSRTDPWTVATQMQNQPSSSLLNELQRYPVGECALVMHDDLGWMVVYPPGAEGAEERPLARPLASMDLGMGVDPAATERYINARTSRSAIVLWALDEDGNYILIDGVVDYMETFDMYDYMFELRERYMGPYRVCVLEKQGPFRLLGPQLDRLQKNRGKFLNVVAGGGGDKDAAIRAALTDPLGRGKVFLVKDPPMSRLREAPSIYGEWLREKNSFPQSHLKDCLDATRLIWPALIRPLGAQEREAKERAGERFQSRSASVTGY